MKRLLFFITGWLLCGALSAQNINQCEYWYDNDYAGRQSVTNSGNTLQWLADATNLSAGLHYLNLHVQDTLGRWYSPRSFAFLHYPTPQSATATYTCLFDEDSTTTQSGTLVNGNMLVDASMLKAGPHVLTLVCQIGTYTRVQQFLFYHHPNPASAGGSCLYWFDNDLSTSTNVPLANGSLLIDASMLSPGLHQLNFTYSIRFEIHVESFMFYKMPETPIATALTFHYRVDGGEFQTETVTTQGAMVTLNLDMNALAEGTHTIEHYITNGNNDVLSPLQTDQFVRTHITQYYTLTLLVNDEDMGYTMGGGVHADDELVSFEAIPYNGYIFDHWNDNMTTNPREIMLTCDTTFTAYFDIEDGVDDYASEGILIYAHQGNINVSFETPMPVWVYDMSGKMLVSHPVDGSSNYSIPLPTGVYLVKAGETYVKKVVVTE